MLKNQIKISYSYINILDGKDMPFNRLPLIKIASEKPGPTVWITACVHGDEVGGIIVTQELVKKLKLELQCGNIFIIPLMNPLGFETMSRVLTLSSEDLNRSFPGNPNGSLAKRIAHHILSNITASRPDLVLDLHNDWSYSIPHALIDRRPNKNLNNVYKKVEELVKISGLLPVIDTDEPQGSLSDSLVQKGIPSFTLELGESYIVNEDNVRVGVKSVWNILAHLKMVKTYMHFKYPIRHVVKEILVYSDKPLVSVSGIVRFKKYPGDFIKKGENFAEVYNIFGKCMESLTAKQNAVMLGFTDFAVAFPGTPVVALANYKEKNDQKK